MLVAQLCPTLCDLMDCILSGSSVHGILQARILQWVAIPFYRGSSWPSDRTWILALQIDSLPSEPPGRPLQQSTSILYKSLSGFLEVVKLKIKTIQPTEIFYLPGSYF